MSLFSGWMGYVTTSRSAGGKNSALVGALVRHQIEKKELAFTPEQELAIAHRGGALILRGGPGTGKTSVIVEAAISRISQGADPNSILMITYGREGASELRDAVALHTSAVMKEPIARTFHSLAFSILKMKSRPEDAEPILMSGPEQDFFIRQLLEGDLEMGATYWPSELIDADAPAIATRGFARELRDLILRAAERDLSPQDLSQMAMEHGEKYWQASARFWNGYLEALYLQESSAGDAKRKIDPSQIVIEAFHHLRNNPDLAAQLRGRFTTILVDEFQESDPAQRKLLRELAGADLVLAVDKQSAVGRFRGADPDALETELERYLQTGSEISLRECFRSVPAIFNIGSIVASKFPDPKIASSRICGVIASATDQAPIAATLRSESEEAQFIAYQFRRAHLMQNLPWSQMAVILRAPGAQAGALRRAFVQSGIPVASQVEALSGNSAIAPLLLLAEISLGLKELTATVCEALLLSEFGGADSISLRRLKRALLASRGGEDRRSGAQLLANAIETGEVELDGAGAILRIHALLESAKKILRRRSAQGEDLLWEIWSQAQTSTGEKLSENWQRQALRGGSHGAAADRDLDAMMQLFESARRFAERFPFARPESFIRQISQEQILGDVITAKGQRLDVVEILTVHAAKGREWQLVAVAGLQEGAWPNLRQRGSLLGSERLVERVRHGSAPLKELDARAASGLVEDERRLIYVAVTRAMSGLILTCVQKDDLEPSIFYTEISEFLQEISGEKQSLTRVPRPLTANALVATLRAELSRADTDKVELDSEINSEINSEISGTTNSALENERSAQAAAILRRLADEGIAVADPNSWCGVLPISSAGPVVAANLPVSVSPSSSESFTNCGLKWFLEKSGGSDGDSTAQVLGSAIHAFAALMESDKSLTEEDLVEKLTSAWNLISPEKGWVRASQLVRAVEMIRKFVAYHLSSPREIVGVEAAFSVEVGRARIRGSVDRLEVTRDGDLYVIDFKTGSVIPSIADAQKNMQMQAYQLAISEGGFSQLHDSRISAGAELVFLGNKTKAPTIRSQSPIDFEEVKTEIAQIADGMSASSFFAKINKNCDRCGVRSSCPIQSEGRAVME